MLHITDISWKKIKHPSEFATLGQEIEVVVLEIDAENRKLSLGHKQLEENPWDVFETVFSEGSIHEATIVGKQDKGFLINTVEYGVEAFIPNKNINCV